jgi:hypothetical protein
MQYELNLNKKRTLTQKRAARYVYNSQPLFIHHGRHIFKKNIENPYLSLTGLIIRVFDCTNKQEYITDTRTIA